MKFTLTIEDCDAATLAKVLQTINVPAPPPVEAMAGDDTPQRNYPLKDGKCPQCGKPVQYKTRVPACKECKVKKGTITIPPISKPVPSVQKYCSKCGQTTSWAVNASGKLECQTCHYAVITPPGLQLPPLEAK